MQTGRARWAWLVAAAIAVGAGGWWWTHRGPAPAADSPQVTGGTGGARPGSGDRRRGARGGDQAVPVRVAEVRRQDMDVVLDALGTVTPVASATVRVRVDGLLQAVLFQEGQVVRAGQVLARIDPAPFEVALAQAQGQLQRDRALLDNARLEARRLTDLVRQDAASAQQLAAQQAQVAQYEGTLKVDQAAVDDARLKLGYTQVTAPLSGRIGLRQVDPGNMVRSTDTAGLAVINQVQPIAVVFAVPQDQLAALKGRSEGLAVQAFDRNGGTVLGRGTLMAVDNQVDATTGTVKLKARFANEDSRLFPNQFVNVRLRLDRLKAIPTVPEAAVLRGAQGAYVYVIDQGKARMQTVRTGPREAGRVAIQDGLTGGEQVVIDGSERLEDGSRVEVVPEAAGRAASGASGASSAEGGRRARADHGAAGGGRPAH
ncbi:MAG: efflux RND transporter periplasmic adaptor subunit [Aquabacterium sp.]